MVFEAKKKNVFGTSRYDSLINYNSLIEIHNSWSSEQVKILRKML